MNKQELIDAIAESADVPKAQAAKMVAAYVDDATLDAVKQAIARIAGGPPRPTCSRLPDSRTATGSGPWPRCWTGEK